MVSLVLVHSSFTLKTTLFWLNTLSHTLTVTKSKVQKFNFMYIFAALLVYCQSIMNFFFFFFFCVFYIYLTFLLHIYIYINLLSYCHEY